ncbi:MAG: hypothetical protein ABWW66_07900 [Archaeoglobaceae archaeon]
MRLYSVLGRGYCVIRGESVSCYLLSDEEVRAAESLKDVLASLPKDFELGVFDAGIELCVWKKDDCFVVFPLRGETLYDLKRKLEGVGDEVYCEEEG